MENFDQEIWLPIKDYEGLYEVSNLGRVKNLNYRHTGIERILKECKGRHYYLRVELWKDRKGKKHFIHRLVAAAFIPNPHNLPEINHIDHNVQNNKAANLEWCDRQYNIDYSHSKNILQYTHNGEFIAEYKSSREAERVTGIRQGSISHCALGNRSTAGGYIWKYKGQV